MTTPRVHAEQESRGILPVTLQCRTVAIPGSLGGATSVPDLSPHIRRDRNRANPRTLQMPSACGAMSDTCSEQCPATKPGRRLLENLQNNDWRAEKTRAPQ